MHAILLGYHCIAVHQFMYFLFDGRQSPSGVWTFTKVIVATRKMMSLRLISFSIVDVAGCDATGFLFHVTLHIYLCEVNSCGRFQ